VGFRWRDPTFPNSSRASILWGSSALDAARSSCVDLGRLAPASSPPVTSGLGLGLAMPACARQLGPAVRPGNGCQGHRAGSERVLG
jgi:hypothetical protein